MAKLLITVFFAFLVSGNVFAEKALSDFQQDLQRSEKIVKTTQEIQCQDLKNNTFIDAFTRYMTHESDMASAKKISDQMYERAFKNCVPKSGLAATHLLRDTCKKACGDVKSSSVTFSIECQNICQIFNDRYVAMEKAIQSSFDKFSPKDSSAQSSDCSGHVDTSKRNTQKPKNLDAIPGKGPSTTGGEAAAK